MSSEFISSGDFFDRDSVPKAPASAGDVSPERPQERQKTPSKPAPDATSDGNDRVTVIDDPRQPRNRFHRELGEKVAATARVFHFNGEVYTDLGGKFESVTKASVLGSFVGDIINLAKTNEKGDTKYIDLSPRDADYLMNAAEQKARLLQVNYYTDTPVMDDDWDATVPGFNPKGGIYFEGKKITPVQDLTHTKALLESIHFKRTTDATNFLGFLLTPILGRRLPGGRPMMLLKGNQPSVGKTTAAQGAAVLASARGILSSVTYKTNDTELEKEIGACILLGSNFILLDNIWVPANVTIRSASLERTLTMPEYNFRRIGTSKLIRGTNYLQFAATYNGGRFKPDLASRCVPILLHYRGDPAQMPAAGIGPIVDWVREHREVLLAELLGMFRTWRDAGGREIPTHCRFREWAAIINGVLTENGFTEFLTTHLEDRGEADELQMAFEELALHRPNHYQPASAWRRDAEYVGVFKPTFAGRTDRAKDTQMGTILKSGVGRKVRMLDEDGNVVAMFELASRKNRDTTLYAFDSPGGSGRPDEQQQQPPGSLA